MYHWLQPFLKTLAIAVLSYAVARTYFLILLVALETRYLVPVIVALEFQTFLGAALIIDNVKKIKIRLARSKSNFEDDPPCPKWSDLKYVFDIEEECNG